MKARKLIDGASFGPDTVKAMGEALDQAWAEIAGHFGDTLAQVEDARLRLAEALLSVATDGSNDVAALKAGALHAMAMDYRSGVRARPSLKASAMAIVFCRNPTLTEPFFGVTAKAPPCRGPHSEATTLPFPNCGCLPIDPRRATVGGFS